MRRRRLTGVRGDQLQIHAGSKANQRVPGALAGMTPARLSPNPGPTLQPLNLLLEVVPSPYEMIDWRELHQRTRSSRSQTLWRRSHARNTDKLGATGSITLW